MVDYIRINFLLEEIARSIDIELAHALAEQVTIRSRDTFSYSYIDCPETWRIQSRRAHSFVERNRQGGNFVERRAMIAFTAAKIVAGRESLAATYIY